jgi:UDP-N-acetylglucosamine 2-epimerase (non-hydrolysing)
MKKNIAVVAGTRPEMIKLWSVIRELRKYPGSQITLINTGQQRELSRQATKSLGLKTVVDLNVMRPNQSIHGVVSAMMPKLKSVFREMSADLVVVQGDTSSTFAGAWSAFELGIPVAHVEAGLRTYDVKQPFPEEIFRTLVDQLSTLHFAPTHHAARCLMKEGIPKNGIIVTGNTAVDALLDFIPSISSKNGFVRPYALVTLHRRENFSSAIRVVSRSLAKFLQNRPDFHIVWPVHPNPNVRKAIDPAIRKHPRVLLTDPLPYPEFVSAMKGSEWIVSDSGGIQEEAPTLGKKVIVVRNVTERPEGVWVGTSYLAGTSPKSIYAAMLKVSRENETGRKRNPFGDGKAGRRIAKVICEFLKKESPALSRAFKINRKKKLTVKI